MHNTLPGRALGNWYTDDPSVGNYGDANCLRVLIYIHMHPIVQAVKSAYLGAKFEWLLPMDVDNPRRVLEPELSLSVGRPHE